MKSVLICFLALLVQVEPFCHEHGECVGGNVIGLSPGDSTYNECLDFCKETPNCNYFTYNEDTLSCLAYDSCPTLSTNTCNNCYSGQTYCNYYVQCGLPGRCIGVFLYYEMRDSEHDCIAMCHSTNGCLYYTYDTYTQACNAYSSCAGLDNSCLNCVSGESKCGNVDPGTDILDCFLCTTIIKY